MFVFRLPSGQAPQKLSEFLRRQGVSLTLRRKLRQDPAAVRVNGQAAAWVKDTRGGLLANMPFVLGREIAEENKLRAELEALSDKKVWIDRNRVAKSELSADVDHLVPLTITGFKSAGPFSELYVMTFEQANGEPLVWQLSATGNRAAYSHSQYLQLFQRDFYGQDPVSLHPEWPAAVW